MRTDEQIRDDIAERIAHLCEWNTTFRKYDIMAGAVSGHVTPSDTVDWPYQRADARGHISRLRRMTGATNSTSIRPCASSADLKQEISAALQKSAGLKASSIKFGPPATSDRQSGGPIAEA